MYVSDVTDVGMRRLQAQSFQNSPDVARADAVDNRVDKILTRVNDNVTGITKPRKTTVMPRKLYRDVEVVSTGVVLRFESI